MLFEVDYGLFIPRRNIDELERIKSKFFFKNSNLKMIYLLYNHLIRQNGTLNSKNTPAS